MERLGRRIFALRSMLAAVLLASGLSLAGLAAVRHSISQAALRESNDVVGNYLQTLGSIYAVLLAFVVYVVWSQFNEARTLVDREANEVLDLYRTVEALHGTERCAVRDGLRRYVDAVIEHEWDAMARRRESQGVDVGQILDDTWDALHVFEPTTAREIALFDECLKRFNDLSDARADRVTSALARIPFALHLLLYGGAVIVVGSMWLFAVQSVWIHAFITSAMAGAVSHVLYVVRDLDDSFSGDWQVDPEPFKRVRRYMRRDRVQCGPAPGL
ncbi:MAG: hypothetical protein JWM10_5445 [Myxococcaceae bacterium]|nr:hypothetical protein [Myxococcaceae bacterium]